MKKVHFISIILVVALCLAGCQSNNVDMGQAEQTNETSQQAAAEETTAPEESINVYETLAEGQERDWNIEDVLKSDLEIDGISVSIPCTMDELLSVLGNEYSISEDNYLIYDSQETMLSVRVFPDDKSAVAGFSFTNIGCEKGILDIGEVHDSLDKFLGKYTFPDKIEKESNKETIIYIGENCYLDCIHRNDIFTVISIGYKTGENE